MWSKNGSPVSTDVVPPPSTSSAIEIDVSLVARSRVAVRLN
jgi:hypothetical protein